jgi:catechol 2,3-dioxygenase-like lactoylglutathione lyase family enzyme
VIDHVSLDCDDLAASAAFYDAVLAPLGVRRVLDVGMALGYGGDNPTFWIATAVDPRPHREVHVAFTAADSAAVDAFFRAATDQGAEALHAPRLWPEYHEGYYAAFVRDPDGNNVEAVCHHGG